MSKASNAELPKSVDPYRLAEHNTTLEGFVPLSGLSRFREAVLGFEDGAGCQVILSFSQDSERRRIVSGKLDATVNLECQRCMSPMAVRLTSDFVLGLVTTDEQAQQLPRDLEPFLTEDFSADLWSMVEDELLLVLPPFPLHGRDECPAREDLEAYEPDGSPVEQESPAKENPFSVLADLKKTKH
ncbi:YceD family protein [Marinobacter koreensis]|uniref:Large ribosomal RNA subunit accumulation protein YceD n=1 Tax=Marinobacter koreensis TaxID=335974 RepID=A0ABW0RL02_9GAMM|nr:YceD family protein [Marinobacter koreensis]MCK7547230.1 YceD family protein [Marinobacter koreensis]MDX1816329.1 YceD family protein [Marinobacter sp.]